MGCMYVNMDGAPVVSEHVAEGGVHQRDWARFNVVFAIPHHRNAALVAVV